MCVSRTDRTLPRHISVSRAIGKAAVFAGKVELRSLDRLHGLLANCDGFVSVDLMFGKDDYGRRAVTGDVAGGLSVYCQRCLEEMQVPVQQAVKLALVDSEEQAQLLPGHLESMLVNDDELDLFELVAEELLLALPIVSAHAEKCGEQQYMRAAEPTRLAPRQKPFEDLADLLGKQ